MNADELAELEAKAQPAEQDIEVKLERLRQLAEIRRKKPEIEAEYENLRNELSTLLNVRGQVYFLDENGWKHYAYTVTPEPLVTDVNELIRMYKDGEITEATLDEAAPRKVVAEGFKRACNAGRITKEQLIRSSKIKKGTAHVRFEDPDHDD